MNSTGMVLGVTGAKGGVGKTTTSINLCAAFAAADIETALVEFDLAMANVVDFLTFAARDEPDPTLHDVLAGEVAVKEATYEVAPNFDVVPSGTSLDGYAKTDLENAPEAVAELRAAYDIVVLDTGAGLNGATVTPVELADGVVVVSTPRVASIRDADKTRTLAERVETDVLGLVLTKSGTGNAPEADRIADFLETRLLGHVPDDEAVPASQDQGRPVVRREPDSDAARTYRRIGRTIRQGRGLADGPAAASALDAEATAQTGSRMVGDGGMQTACPTATDSSDSGPTEDAPPERASETERDPSDGPDAVGETAAEADDTTPDGAAATGRQGIDASEEPTDATTESEAAHDGTDGVESRADGSESATEDDEPAAGTDTADRSVLGRVLSVFR